MIEKYKDKIIESRFLNGGSSEPYIVEEQLIKKYIMRYNPEYGDSRVCECGHSYYRHFDSWEDMDSCGCKYCNCGEFVEK